MVTQPLRALASSSVKWVCNGTRGRRNRLAPRPPLSLLQLSGDLEDLELALNKTKTRHTLGSGSCSALIKLLPGRSDLLVAHNTWNSYQNMLRVIKKYSFQFRQGPQGGCAWACLCASVGVGAQGGELGGAALAPRTPRCP